MKDAPVRIAIIGAGKMGRAHALAFDRLPNAEVVGIASRSGTTADALAAELGGCTSDADWRRLVERTQPDACVVAVSHDVNESMTRAVLEDEFPVLAEKPVAFASGSVRDLAALAAAQGVVAMAGMNRRYYPGVLDAIESVRFLGGLVGVTLFAPDPVKPRRASGAHAPFVFDQWTVAQTLHAIDLVRLAGGEPPDDLHVERVRAAGENNIAVTYRSSAGVLVTIVSCSSSGGSWELRLHGVGCEATLAPLEGGRLRIQGSSVTRSLATPASTDVKHGVLEQAAAFADAVALGRLAWPASSLADHARSIQLAERLSDAGGAS